MRIVDEARQPFRKPMIPPRLLAPAIHALLHDGPMAVVGDDEAVQIEVEAVLHRRAVHLGNQPAGLGQRRPIDADTLADRDQLLRGLPRMPAASAADVNAELVAKRRQSALERPDHARGNAGGVPVHAHDGAERLEPEWTGEPAQQLVAPVMMNDGLGQNGAEPRHPLRQPGRDPPAMQRQIGASGAACHRSRIPRCGPGGSVHALYPAGPSWATFQ